MLTTQSRTDCLVQIGSSRARIKSRYEGRKLPFEHKVIVPRLTLAATLTAAAADRLQSFLLHQRQKIARDLSIIKALILRLKFLRFRFDIIF